MKNLPVLLLVIVLCLMFAAGGWATGTTYNGYPVVNLVVNGQALNPDVPAIIMDGRTLVPARAIAEALNAEANWDANNNTIYINQVTPSMRSTSLDKYNYLLSWHSIYGRLGNLQNEARDLSIFIRQNNSFDSYKLSQKMYSLSFQTEELYKELSIINPPPEASALHRESLKELVLWATCYKLTAKGSASGKFYNIEPFSEEAYKQNEVTWALLKALE